ncbi:sigma-54-dependent transcriptional regulator [Humisphaera borealis]|uniref:Sigma-54-dependent Fis family transcriptional regulator n=1 Tax=Humisphaera borealis TaxID=2807512 RepID=A0A7M2WXV5_9BACT|nr:sigma-54 dependent transcriptional regulator [Humisphaera borealis]QOV89350.1 sigma-54-dependent Fis family transcriptional regulator [Humisphaera borealis]
MTTKPRLLILDEDRIILQSLGQFLRREGYEVRTTDVPDNAMGVLESNQVEVFLADINIPGIKPADFLRDMRRRFPHVVVVVITSYGSIEGAVEATKIGAFDYLTKPIVDEEIRVVVEKAARQQSLLFENQSLKQQLDMRFGLGNVVGHDHKMLKIFDLVGAVADSRTTALITGESGTGKSLIARAIHQQSPRKDKPFIEVSCGALPETLLESELFGHVKGAFTGAISDKPGRFLSADGGTLFLDEINSASPMMQVKLLRMLQERTFEPVGSSESKTVDVRVVLATNVDLALLVADQKFRQDLYYRINVVNVKLPPLRDRLGDITLLATHFLRRFCQETGREVIGFSEPALSAMHRYTWPGNVRELENAIERAVVLSRRPQIDLEDLPETVQGMAIVPAMQVAGGGQPGDGYDTIVLQRPMPLEQALEIPERHIIEAALKRNHWNRQATAAELAINRTTLYKKMRKFGMLGVGEVA